MLGQDLTPFFSTAEFADEGTLDGAPVAGIFDRAYVRQGEGLGMSSTAPAVTLPTAQIVGEPEGQSFVLTRTGEAFIVAAHEPDGTGVSVLFLELAP